MAGALTLGPWVLLTPLALLGLLFLPIIWWVLRATPPAPKEHELPSLRLLEAIEIPDQTPDRTPWWILLLRLSAAALLIAGLARPIHIPVLPTTVGEQGPLLVVIDNGWSSAQRWSEIQNAAFSSLDGEPQDRAIHLLLTAPRRLNHDPDLRLDRSTFEARIKALQPHVWQIDRAEALDRLEQADLQPGRIFYISNGLEPATALPFVNALAARAPLSLFAARPKGAFALTELGIEAEGVHLNVVRADTSTNTSPYVSALTLEGRALATAEVSFEPDANSARAAFSLPPAALARIARFQITNQQTAGAVWLWDSTSRTRRVGLVSADTTAQPLLTDMHYIRRALAPFAQIREGALTQLIDENPDAIVLTDIGQIEPEILPKLEAWIETGGALIRFAGPRLAAQSDTLVPVPLRRASRAIGGGTLTWEEPQPIGAFPETSPFAGLSIPSDILVRQQVLALPGPELANRTWARLQDGSPLVTARPQGAGNLILYHVTAGPDWSDLPYSGVFVELLKRTIAAGQGQSTFEETGLYVPDLSLNARGRLTQPDASATPIEAEAFADLSPSETHPAGFYQGPAGLRALNVAADYTPIPVTNWPNSAVVLGDAEAKTLRLGGPLILAGLLLCLIDVILAIGLAGRLRLSRQVAMMSIGFLAFAVLPNFSPAEAQFGFSSPTDYTDQPKDVQAALELRLAYVETGNRQVDRATRAGLQGLSLSLFRRSSVEPAEPHAVNLETDNLQVYPLLFMVLPDNPAPFSETAMSRLNAYLREGGSLFIDTRQGDRFASSEGFDSVRLVFAGLDAPPLTPVPTNHVLTRSFYLLTDFPGRFANRPLWIEATAAGEKQTRRGDGVSRIFVGDADFLAAWAIDERGGPLYSVDGGDRQREQAIRFGINLVVYVLTGNYKEDQVHIPALLERLGDIEGVGDFEVDTESPLEESEP